MSRTPPGQFAQLMKTETGFDFTGKINRYDGRPFLVEELIGEISAYRMITKDKLLHGAPDVAFAIPKAFKEAFR